MEVIQVKEPDRIFAELFPQPLSRKSNLPTEVIGVAIVPWIPFEVPCVASEHTQHMTIIDDMWKRETHALKTKPERVILYGDVGDPIALYYR